MLLTDCKNTFHLEHGHAEFSGDVTPYGGMVPVVCSEGYEIEGDHVITCLADGNWSTSTSCRVKGITVAIAYFYHIFYINPNKFIIYLRIFIFILF